MKGQAQNLFAKAKDLGDHAYTVIKGWQHPHEERTKRYAVGAMAGLLLGADAPLFRNQRHHHQKAG